jgi:arsenate reductase
MAAAYLKAILGEDVDVRCGGTEPAQDVDVNVKRVMAEDGVSLERAKPRALDLSSIAAADRVIAMGCAIGDVRRLPRVDEDWGIEDVEGLDLDAARAIRDGIKRRVLGLVGNIRRGDLGAPTGMLYAEELVPWRDP